MSLIGIDVGSSSIKVDAYRSDGQPLAGASEALTPRRSQPGWWEIEPEDVWMATLKGLSQVARATAVQRDPPESLAISASGREAFPVDQNGVPLGPCIMAGDTRGAALEVLTASRMETELWYQACGHIPERMDPVNRLLWWRRHHPHVMAQSSFFLGWHEFLTLRLGRRAVTDRSLAGKWLIYDLAAGAWSPQRLAEFEIDPRTLPDIQPWGAVIAELKPSVASQVGLPQGVKIAVGGFDASCAALGAGASDAGVGGLVSGTWEDLIVPTSHPPSAEIVRSGLSVGPHPGSAGLAVFALSPNGTAVIDWARSLMGVSLPELKTELEKSGPQPSLVLAIPHLSGATVPWANGRKSRGTLTGLTLGSSPTDIIKALMEGITFDLLLTLQSLRQAGLSFNVLRAAGGGTRSDWWMQLKADLSGLPIEAINQPEPGTLFHRNGWILHLDGRMLGVESFQPDSREIPDRRQSFLTAESPPARINDHSMACGFADDGGQHAQRWLEVRGKSEIGRVHGQVCAGLDFSDAGIPRGDRVGCRATGAHNLTGDTMALDEVSGINSQLQCRATSDLFFRVRRIQLHAAFIPHHAADDQPLFRRRHRQRERGLTGRHPATIQSDIHINEHAELGFLVTGYPRHLGDDASIINGNQDVGLPRQFRQSAELRRADDFARNQDAPDSVLHERFGLFHRGAGDANRAGVELFRGEPDALVILEMRAQGRLALADKPGHFQEIPLHGWQVQEQRRSIQFVSLALVHLTPQSQTVRIHVEAFQTALFVFSNVNLLLSG